MNERIKLNDGLNIPVLGLGTWKLKGEECVDAVKKALEVGYRHIDTAAIYENEAEVGRAIAESGIPREEIFVTTKLWNDDHHDPRGALQTSLENLNLDYVDLYLIHWPVPERQQTYRAFEELQKDGLTKSIGVSNFTIDHLEALLQSTDVVPAVNQVEFNPFLYQKELLEYCQEKQIVIEAYSPITHAKKLDDSRLKDIADKHGKTSAQILLRWAIQQGMVVIPKSSNPERITENSEIFDFELDSSEMDEMNSWDEGLRNTSDPNKMP